MGRNKYKAKVYIHIIITTVVLTLLCLVAVHAFHPGDEAAVGIFSLAATLVGTIFIAVELKNGSDVTCSEMLIELNNNFHESDRLMLVYEVLESGDSCKPEAWAKVPGVAVAQYCTFFENLYLLYRHNIASIDDLDDLFGYRFFLFTNNPYIQEHYILPTSSSYVQIFELYKVWIKHRKKENEGLNGWQRNVPWAKYTFTDHYLKHKLYLHEKTAEEKEHIIDAFDNGIQMRTFSFEHLSAAFDLQKSVYDGIEDKDIFYPLSRSELIESMHLDHVIGMFTPEGQLTAFCVVINNRTGQRNLAYTLHLQPSESLTFDAVVVGKEWRGRHFQQIMIEWAIRRLARSKQVKYILATVSPDNTISKRNFLVKGFKVAALKTMYGGLKRNVLLWQSE